MKKIYEYTKPSEAVMKVMEKPAEVEGILPVDRKGRGPGVRILYADGSHEELDLAAEAYVHQLSRANALNVKLLQKALQKALQIRYLVPMPLSRELMLVPFKTREAAVKGDSSLGYVNLHAVEDETQGGTVLRLKSGRRFPCLNRARTVNRRIVQARYGVTFLEELMED